MDSTPNWKTFYESAVLEMDSAQLAKRVETAKSVILSRLAEIGVTRDVHKFGALSDALRVLTLLEKHKPWRKKAA